MKNILFLLLFITPILGAAQFTSRPGKIQLGYQTTANGLVCLVDSIPAFTPSDQNDCFLAQDTTANKIYIYKPSLASWEEFSSGIALIDSIENVLITSPVNGQVLRYDGTKWINSTERDTSDTNEIQYLVFSGDTLGLTDDPTSVVLPYLEESEISSIVSDSISLIVIDSTRLLQDSILAYYQAGSEIGRDTLSLAVPETDPIYAADSPQLKADIAANAGLTLQQVTDNGNTTTNTMQIGGSYTSATGLVIVDSASNYQTLLKPSGLFMARSAGNYTSQIYTAGDQLKFEGRNIFNFYSNGKRWMRFQDGEGQAGTGLDLGVDESLNAIRFHSNNSFNFIGASTFFTDSVGIGTTTPSHILDVTGTVGFNALSNGSVFTELVTRNDLTGELGYSTKLPWNNTTTNRIPYWSGNSWENSGLVPSLDGGLGIKVSNPNSVEFDLHVKGNIAAFGPDTLQKHVIAGSVAKDTNWRFSGITYDRENDVAKWGTYRNIGLIEDGFISINNSGNAGINTNTPAYKLDVTGTGRFTDRLFLETIDEDNTNTSLLAADPVTGEVEERTVASINSGNTLQSVTDNGSVTTNDIEVNSLKINGAAVLPSNIRNNLSGSNEIIVLNTGINRTQTVTDRVFIRISFINFGSGSFGVTTNVYVKFEIAPSGVIRKVTGSAIGKWELPEIRIAYNASNEVCILFGEVGSGVSLAGSARVEEINYARQSLDIDISSILVSNASSTTGYTIEETGVIKVESFTPGAQNIGTVFDGNLVGAALVNSSGGNSSVSFHMIPGADPDGVGQSLTKGVKLVAYKTSTGATSGNDLAIELPSTFSSGTPVERFRFQAEGRLGINTTTPTYELDVSGEARVTDRVYFETVDEDNTNTSLLAADPVTGEVEEVTITNPTGGANTLQASLDNINESTTVLTDSTKNANANFSTIFDATTSTEVLLSIAVTTSSAIVTLPNPSASLVGHKIKLFNFTSSNNAIYTVSSGNFWLSGVYVSSYSVPTDGRIDNLTCIYSPENGTYVWAVESN